VSALRAAVIGHPVGHSRSPALFAEFARTTGIGLRYEAVDVAPEELAHTLATWRHDPEFVGCNVTIPHKRDALALADRVEPAALACGAANVLTRIDETLVADNTDVAGIERALALHGVELRGSYVAIIGTGGAARAAAAAARRSGAAGLAIAGRNPKHTEEIAQDFAAIECTLRDVPVSTIYINATPLGMTGQPQISLLPANAPRGAVAFDLVYTPPETPFLRDAAARGLKTIPGTSLFVAQAVATFVRWFGVVPEGQELVTP
jgi:shikimate dehydrogenase